MGYREIITLDEKIGDIHEVVYNNPGYYCIKDIEGKYLYVNKNLLRDSGYRSLNNIEGKTDFEVPWAVYADIYQNHNKNVIENNCSVCKRGLIKTHKQEDVCIETDMAPFYHNNELVGVLGVSVKLTLESMRNPIIFNDEMAFYNLKTGKVIQLSPLKKRILHQVVLGKSSKEIGNYLQRSNRTIENHIDEIKDICFFENIKDLLVNVRIV